MQISNNKNTKTNVRQGMDKFCNKNCAKLWKFSRGQVTFLDTNNTNLGKIANLVTGYWNESQTKGQENHPILTICMSDSCELRLGILCRDGRHFENFRRWTDAEIEILWAAAQTVVLVPVWECVQCVHREAKKILSINHSKSWTLKIQTFVSFSLNFV